MSDGVFKENDPNQIAETKKRTAAKEQGSKRVAGTQSNREKRVRERTARNGRPAVKKQRIKRKRKSGKARDDNYVHQGENETTNRDKKMHLSNGKGSKNGAERRKQSNRQCTRMSAKNAQSSGGGSQSSIKEDSRHNSQRNTGARPKKQLAG